MTKLSTSKIILEKLGEASSLSVHELATGTGFSEPVIRYHLRKFKNIGIVCELPQHDTGLKAGRKAPNFRRLISSSEKNIVELCQVIMDHLSDLTGKPSVESIEKIVDWMLIDLNPGKKLTGLSIREIVEWFTKYNYFASWEAGKNGPEIIFRHCPYESIRTGNDLTCKLDLGLLQSMSGHNWEAVGTIDQIYHNGYCRFIMSNNSLNK